MSAFVRWMHGREYIKLLLHWRWLVLVIAIPISLVIELLEEQGTNMQLLDEVLIDGLVLPFTTWIVLTFAARKMAAQFEREALLEQHQQFNQRLSQLREYDELTRFVVRFPPTMLPVEHVILSVMDPGSGAMSQVAEWRAAGPADRETVPQYLVLMHANAQVGVLRLEFGADRLPSAAQREQLGSFAPDIAAALVRAIEDHRQAEQAYREARAYERRRLTQELHDSLAQQIFYLHLSLDQLAEAGPGGGEALQRQLASLRDVAADVYEQVRHNLSILRAWEQVNLSEALSELARVSAHNADMSVEIDVQGEPAWLSPHTCEQLYSVVREALNNIARHARAKHVQLELSWAPERLQIRLVDDGVGFDAGQRPPEGHYGLALMRETVESLRGELTIESSRGRGTGLVVSVPLGPDDRELRHPPALAQQLLA